MEYSPFNGVRYMEDTEDKNKTEPTDAPWEFKAGETISPASMPTQPERPAHPPATPVEAQPITTPIPPISDEVLTPTPIAPETTAFPGNQEQDYLPPDEPLVSWTASEFIRHEKSTDWYLTLAVIDVVFAILTYLMFRDVVTTVVVVVAGIGFGVYANRKPAQQQYALGDDGLAVGERLFAYNDFRSFSVVNEGAFTSIQFTPLKRFGIPVNMYYDPKDEAAILQIVGSRLPMEEVKRDVIDSLLKRIRF